MRFSVCSGEKLGKRLVNKQVAFFSITQHVTNTMEFDNSINFC